MDRYYSPVPIYRSQEYYCSTSQPEPMHMDPNLRGYAPVPMDQHWNSNYSANGFQTNPMGQNPTETVKSMKLKESLSMEKLIQRFTSQNYKYHNVNNFIGFARREMLRRKCDRVEELTRNQFTDQLWHKLRIGRITASNIYEASRCRTPNGSLVNRIIRGTENYASLPMTRGQRLERQVIERVSSTQNMEIKSCGLFLIPSLPMFGASPDGINNSFIVEVKCPSVENMNYYVRNGVVNEKYVAQMMLGMCATGRKEALFIVADPQFERNQKFETYWIYYDERYMGHLIERAKRFWEDNIFPKLLNEFDRSYMYN